jgi:hypothetical protein
MASAFEHDDMKQAGGRKSAGARAMGAAAKKPRTVKRRRS